MWVRVKDEKEIPEGTRVRYRISCLYGWYGDGHIDERPRYYIRGILCYGNGVDAGGRMSLWSEVEKWVDDPAPTVHTIDTLHRGLVARGLTGGQAAIAAADAAEYANERILQAYKDGYSTGYNAGHEAGTETRNRKGE